VSGNADVTAVVACFNYGRYLAEAVDSLLSQAGGAPRVIVVDDGSTDPATEAALDALPAGVEIIRQPNQGVCAARNNGLARLDTDYWLVLDADDRLAPGALAAMRAALDSDPRLGFAYGLMEMFGDLSAVIPFPPYDPYRLLYRHTIGPTALARAELLRATGGYDAGFPYFEDWEIWVNALAHGYEGVRVDAVTFEWRRHGASKLGADRRRYKAAWRALRRKHAALYARRDELAAHSSLGPIGRLMYRWFWGPRPVPAALEAAVQRALWSASRARGARAARG
jgi:glycosyltransferase involved in cell wall biosynthesis